MGGRVSKLVFGCNPRVSSYADAEQQNQLLRKKSALAVKCVTMLQEEKVVAAAAAEKKNAVLQALCKKLQAEKKALLQQLAQYVKPTPPPRAAAFVLKCRVVLIFAGTGTLRSAFLKQRQRTRGILRRWGARRTRGPERCVGCRW